MRLGERSPYVHCGGVDVDDVMGSNGHAIGFWRGWKILVDGKKQVMPKGGLEPPRPFEHNALNVACLPISPLRLFFLVLARLHA